jgi:hypothetical protein
MQEPSVTHKYRKIEIQRSCSGIPEMAKSSACPED